MLKRFDHESLNKAIAKHGWIVTGVPHGANYTVGLMDKFNHPELMVHGLLPEQAYSVLRAAYALLEKGERLDVDGQEYSGVLLGKGGVDFTVKALRVDRSNFRDWMGQALVYEGDGLRAMQLLWPDEQNRFPGDAEYNQKFAAQLRFDVRRPEYGSIPADPNYECAACKEGKQHVH